MAERHRGGADQSRARSDGFADVWMKDRFAWEYKGKRAPPAGRLPPAQRISRGPRNPPLLVVCDLDRFEIHTNFTGTAKQVDAFTLDDLATAPAPPPRLLRALLMSPDSLRPSVTRQELTEEAAREFANLALALRGRGHEPKAVAHFLDQLHFCPFAEDAGLLPVGVIARLSEATRADPAGFTARSGELFATMSAKEGGYFGTEHFGWLNGGLFDGPPVIPLVAAEVDIFRRVA